MTKSRIMNLGKELHHSVITFSAGNLSSGYLSFPSPRSAAVSMGMVNDVREINDNSAVCHLIELCKDIFKRKRRLRVTSSYNLSRQRKCRSCISR